MAFDITKISNKDLGVLLRRYWWKSEPNGDATPQIKMIMAEYDRRRLIRLESDKIKNKI